MKKLLATKTTAFLLVVGAALALFRADLAALQIKVYYSGIEWQKPPVVDPGPVGGPPSDAIVLFGGKDLSAWQGGDRCKIEDGAFTAGAALQTKEAFGDCQLHLEYASPVPVKGSGQGRGNNGVKLMGRYEIQILDSYDNDTYTDGMNASVYKQHPPLVNACKKPGEWQTFDIVFEAPRFDKSGKLERPAYVTVLHNGVLVHNHFELEGTTAYNAFPSYGRHAEKLPLVLAYHGNPVKFRNIWIRELRELPSERKAEPMLK